MGQLAGPLQAPGWASNIIAHVQEKGGGTRERRSSVVPPSPSGGAHPAIA